MKRWIIHIHYVATDDNKNYAGEEADYYYGKGWQRLNSVYEEHLSPSDLYPGFVKEYGYTRKHLAERGLKLHESFTEKYWTFTCDLIEMDVTA